jgi:hypothetical protein
MADTKDEDSKVISFEDNKDIVIPTDEDTKKKQEKERLRRERRNNNDRVLKSLRLGKHKDK